ncbi:MAG TPA: hypothetical protein VGN34_26830 [Ktedonobacteraceae bacterium]
MRIATASDDRNEKTHRLLSQNDTLEQLSPEDEQLVEAWQDLQCVPSYVERIKQWPALFDTERN